MMWISTIAIIAIFLASPSSCHLVKRQYKWDEKVQLCSTSLNIFFNMICVNYTEGVRFEQNLRDLRGLNADCCEQTCTPLHILKNYCDYSDSVDTTKDLILIPDMQQTGNKSLTKKRETTIKKRRHGSITLTIMMYCYMGFEQFCFDGFQRTVSDAIDTIGLFRTRKL